ncbi:MAG: hypothetical protein ABSG13_24695 [Bryobacteraceae bacterium]|jgi:hypothetical protein
MDETKFPPDWDEQKVQRVLAHYEGQTEEDALAEDEAGIQHNGDLTNASQRVLF